MSVWGEIQKSKATEKMKNYREQNRVVRCPACGRRMKPVDERYYCVACARDYGVDELNGQVA